MPATRAQTERLLLAYSGGLDTSFLVTWLTRERGYEVVTLHVDCGGSTATERDQLRARSLALGAVDHIEVDARAQLFDSVLRWLIAGNVRRGGTYPLCVAAERGLQAEQLARKARELGIGVVAHGCTGAGNDQIRFEAALAIAREEHPGLRVLAPVRDEAFTREQEVEFLERHGFPVPASGGRYSVNAGLWGLTIGGGETHRPAEALPEQAWCWTKDGTGERVFEVAFERGIPVALDGVALDPVALIEKLNVEAGRLGVGRGYHLGDTLLGFKGRIGYEAPAAEILLTAHRELEKLVLGEERRTWKERLGDVYGQRLHQGLLFDPFMRDVESFLASTQTVVTGTARVRARAGGVLVEGVSSPYDMMSASEDVYGERRAAGADPAAAVGLARAWSEPGRLALRAKRRAESNRASVAAEDRATTPVATH